MDSSKPAGPTRALASAQIAEPALRGGPKDQAAGAGAEARLGRGDVVRVRMGNDDGLLRLLSWGARSPPGPADAQRLRLLRRLGGRGRRRGRRYHVARWHPTFARRHPTGVGRRARLPRSRRWRRSAWRISQFAFSGAARRAHDYAGPAAQTWAEEGLRAIYFRGRLQWVDPEHHDRRRRRRGPASRSAASARSRACASAQHVARTLPSDTTASWAKRSQDCPCSQTSGSATQLDDEITVEAFANGNVFMRSEARARAMSLGSPPERALREPLHGSRRRRRFLGSGRAAGTPAAWPPRRRARDPVERARPGRAPAPATGRDALRQASRSRLATSS